MLRSVLSRSIGRQRDCMCFAVHLSDSSKIILKNLIFQGIIHPLL